MKRAIPEFRWDLLLSQCIREMSMQGINRLSDNTIKKTKPSGGVQKLCDGDKLYLFILPTGKKI